MKHTCVACRETGEDFDWTCRKKVCDSPAKSLCPKHEDWEGYD